MPNRSPARERPLLVVASRRAWRSWLRVNHDAVAEIWVVLHKRHTARDAVRYDDVVEEALCYGWIDSVSKRLDDDRYARKFTPRKPNSRWSTANRKRYAQLKERGLLAEPGLARPPTARDGDAPRPSLDHLPAYIVRALDANARAAKTFAALAPSYRRAYVAWIDSAKREETKARRLREALATLAAGKKLGLK